MAEVEMLGTEAETARAAKRTREGAEVAPSPIELDDNAADRSYLTDDEAEEKPAAKKMRLQQEGGSASKRRRPRRGRKRRRDGQVATGQVATAGTSAVQRPHRGAAAKKGPAAYREAPRNTTQFLMNDHSDTIQYLDHKLGVEPNDFEMNPAASDPPRKKVTRARDSSFSLPSDEEFFYSSPEDEEEFVSREFLKDYNRVRADRLVSMSKGDLVGEYLQMEARVDALEKQLVAAKKAAAGAGASSSSTTPMQPEVAKKMRLLQVEVHSLKMDNGALRKENLRLRQQVEARDRERKLPPHQQQQQQQQSQETGEHKAEASSSSDSSSSDSSSSSSDSDSSDDEEEQQEQANEVPAEGVQQGADEEPKEANGQQEDTGYESESSGIKRRKEQQQQGQGEQVVTSTCS